MHAYPHIHTHVHTHERGTNTRFELESIKMKIQRRRDDIPRIIEKRRSRGIYFIYGRIDLALSPERTGFHYYILFGMHSVHTTSVPPPPPPPVDTMHSRLMSNIVRYGTAARAFPQEDGNLRAVTHSGKE